MTMPALGHHITALTWNLVTDIDTAKKLYFDKDSTHTAVTEDFSLQGWGLNSFPAFYNIFEEDYGFPRVTSLVSVVHRGAGCPLGQEIICFDPGFF